ncbi:hypothetical protein CO101_01030, partial [Candidatus Berkelbacteria bacterium CG_4_9_14_3_um_filter_39_23]
KRNVDPQSEALRLRLRMTRGQSVEDGKGCVIPEKTGIQSGLDPQSEALRLRLRMARGIMIFFVSRVKIIIASLK